MPPWGLLLILTWAKLCRGTREIHLAGIFPINGHEGWQGGQACEPAARMALHDVNAQADLLSGYTLRLHWNDSGVSLKISVINSN
jgi:hypothetical protein